MKFIYCKALLLLVLVCQTLSPIHAAAINYSFQKSTPVGSWQIREEMTTNHKGKKTLVVIKTSLVGRETRDGQPYYWVEMETQNYKIKKDKRKKTGDRAIVKSLIAESAMSGNMANVINNLRGFGKEIIFQTGNQEPMAISEGGLLADTMMKAMGIEINYDFQASGNETVKLPAGTFKSQKISGRGSAEMNMIIKKIRIESNSTMWVSSQVPFGIVKAVSNNSVNGKPQTVDSKVVQFGKSGARSQITGEPKSMPGVPGGLPKFGNY